METALAPRFSLESPKPAQLTVRFDRTAWISDIHLGTRGANVAALFDFLRDYEIKTLYIVGDLIDIWQLGRAIYWPQQHNDAIQKILRKARKGTRIFAAATAMLVSYANWWFSSNDWVNP